jgi:hypothetical protein
VHPDRVQQRRIAKGHRRDANMVNKGWAQRAISLSSRV